MVRSNRVSETRGSPQRWQPSKEESRDDIIESSLRREVFEELGIEIEIVRLTNLPL